MFGVWDLRGDAMKTQELARAALVLPGLDVVYAGRLELAPGGAPVAVDPVPVAAAVIRVGDRLALVIIPEEEAAKLLRGIREGK